MDPDFMKHGVVRVMPGFQPYISVHPSPIP